VLYELCTGRPAFRAPTTVAVIRRVCDETARPIRDVNPDIPEPLCRLIESLHAKKPADRPASVHVVADLLAGLLADLNSGSLRPAGGTSARQAPAERTRPARRKWLWTAAALFLLLAGLGVGEVIGLTKVRGTVIRLFSPEGTLVEEVHKESVPFPDAQTWEKSVAGLPAEQQVEAVVGRLKELNPGFDGKVTHTIEVGVVTGLCFKTDAVADVSPVRALTWLVRLECPGTYPKKGKLSDLTPLRGLRLTYLHCAENPIADLSPLRGMPLTVLIAGDTRIADLSALRGMRLKQLTLQSTAVTDLSALKGMPMAWLDLYGLESVSDISPLQGMPLQYLNLSRLPVSDISLLAGMKSLRRLFLQWMPVTDLTPLRGLALKELAVKDTPVADLSPIKGMPLQKLHLDYRADREKLLRSLTGLESINDKPAADFWKEVADK
jgi:hypothetical protein